MANTVAVVSKNAKYPAGSGKTGYDSGSILIVATSGTGPVKQADGGQHSATTLSASQVAGFAGNYLEGTNQNNNKPGTITNIAITANVVTVTCANNFTVGQNVELQGLTTATFLNLVNVVIATVSGSQFTAAFTHANYGSAADTGTATFTNHSRGGGLSIK